MWGEWHIGAFLDMNLPTLLAPGNLPAFAQRLDCRYEIHTVARDAGRILASETYARLTAVMPVNLVLFDETAISDPITTHWRVWNEAHAAAATEKRLLLLMPPDVAWSDGSFRHLAALAEQGKSAIFMTYLRVVADSFIPAFAHIRANRGDVALSGRDLVDLGLRHMHPLMGAYRRDSSYFPSHAEMMLWPVSDQGVVVKLLARELFFFDPCRFTFNEWGQPDGDRAAVSNIHVVEDSDDLFSVTVAPLGKDFAWHDCERQVTPLAVALWRLAYDSPFNDTIARATLRFHRTTEESALWRRRTGEANAFLRRTTMLREGWRLWQRLRGRGARHAGRLLALALQTGAVERVGGRPGRVTVFVPTDRSLDTQLIEALSKQPSAVARRQLIGLLNGHLVIEPEETPSIATRTLGNTTLRFTSAAGTMIEVHRDTNGLQVNGRRVTDVLDDGNHPTICLIEGVLDDGGIDGTPGGHDG